MNNKQLIQELRDILCTVQEIKEDLMELRFWTHISWRDKKSMLWNDDTVWIVYPLSVFTKNWVNVKKSNIDEIIWNPIQERHLRMYFFEKNMNIMIDHEWELFNSMKNTGIFLDNTKDLQDQDTKVLQSIVDFLKANT